MKKIFNKSKKPTCSHDNFFKVFFSEPKLAKELLQLAFSKSELRYFDLNNIKTEKDTYEEKRADLILSIPFQDKSRENLKLLIILDFREILRGKTEKEANEIIVDIVEYLRDTTGLSLKNWQETEKQLIEEGILKKGGVMLIKDVIKEKGRWEGLRKGRQERDKEVVLSMLKEKMNISVIAKVTGLSEKEIKKFKNRASA